MNEIEVTAWRSPFGAACQGVTPYADHAVAACVEVCSTGHKANIETAECDGNAITETWANNDLGCSVQQRRALFDKQPN